LQNSRYAWTEQPGQTLGSLFHLESEPCWVRLLYFNDQPQSWSIDGAAIAATGGAYENDLPWQRVTFCQQGADSEPLLGETSDMYRLEIPANIRDEGQPVLMFSDWLPVRARARQDGGPGYLLQVRTYSAGRQRYSPSVGLPDPSLGRLCGGFIAEVDATCPPWVCQPQSSDRIFASYGLQYISPVAGATVIGIGDSIMHSSCTAGELSGFGVRACAMLSRPERPISYVSEGFPGRNSLHYCANGAWGIRHLSPQIALIQTWSQNEEWSADAADLAFSRAVALADLARRHDCVPILTTAAPVFARDPGPEQHRRANIARVQAAGARGMAVLDLDALWGTGAEPNVYRDDMGCGDFMHPSNAGCQVAGNALAAIIRRLLGDPKQPPPEFSKRP
jgi:hypothetical protein